MDIINLLVSYEKKFIGEYGLSGIADTASVSLIEGILVNPHKTQMLYNSLKKNTGCDCDVWNNARYFNEELVELFPFVIDGAAVGYDSINSP